MIGLSSSLSYCLCCLCQKFLIPVNQSINQLLSYTPGLSQESKQFLLEEVIRGILLFYFFAKFELKKSLSPQMEAMITSNGCGTVVRLQSNNKYKLNKTLREFTMEEISKYSFQRDRISICERRYLIKQIWDVNVCIEAQKSTVVSKPS